MLLNRKHINDMRTCVFLLGLFCLLMTVASSCDNPIGTNKTPAVYGKVTDANGTSLNEVEIHCTPFYRTTVLSDTGKRNLTAAKSSEQQGTIRFNFRVETAALVQLEVLRRGTREKIGTLINEQRAAGDYSVSLRTDSLRMTNGFYIFSLMVGGAKKETEILYTDLNDPLPLADLNPLVRTNTSGEFQLGYDLLGVGKTSQVVDLQGQVLGEAVVDSLQFILYKPGVGVLTESATVKTSDVFERTFRLGN